MIYDQASFSYRLAGLSLREIIGTVNDHVFVEKR